MSEAPAPSDKSTDGRFFAEGRTVYRAPLEKRTDRGHTISVGFPICELTDYAAAGCAEAIAVGLNMALDAGLVE